MRPPLALTPGEPAGIGPDLALHLAQDPRRAARVLAVADPGLLAERARRLGLPFRALSPAARPRAPGELRVDPIALAVPARPGTLDPANAPYVLACLDRAIALCREGRAAGLLTGPVHKGVIVRAGLAFRGHTEYLAERLGVATPVMMLVAGRLRVALATTHLPLAAVPAAITRERLEAVLGVLLDGLRRRFRIERPRVMVLGLNPHAGEEGTLGREEIEAIAPALARFQAAGEAVAGPFAADTAFLPERLGGFDAVLAMYHDQGLPVLKRVGFGRAVNLTLGLPILRLSVDHGVALDRAGTGAADAGSLLAALRLAAVLSR
ncbi:MAG: 4-hydroxythreonine-4-phosphate dehydrogenase PdxA [Xanthomonadales bacterium]|nr:4-hydroxythreonine-4-phosphate dehydrogenase PdxA [Xanthomonadales bacterium]